jgi:WD40 repeat protein
LDLEKKEEIKILQHHTAPVFDIKYSLLTHSFYTVAADGNFAICSLDTLSLFKIKKLCEEKVRSIDLNYLTSEIAVASGDCNIRIFDLVTLEEKIVFVAHQLSANTVRYSPDGKIMLTGGRDAHLTIWDAQTYVSIQNIPAHNYAIYDIAYSPDANMFATASRDKTVKIWDAATFDLLVRINKENYDGHINSVNKIHWSTYKNFLISTGDDRSIMVWDVLPT